MKYTKTEVRGMFKRLLKALDKQIAPIMINDNTDTLNHLSGGWSLDYSAVYGGYVIEEDAEGGGVSHPFGAQRRSSREMYLSMWMTAQALENIKYEKQQLNKMEW